MSPFKRASNALAPWEKATGVAQASQPGLLPRSRLLSLTLLFGLIATLLLLQPLGLPAALVAGFVFGRLTALDLTTYTLPNVYTLPMVVVGLCHAVVGDHTGPALLAVAMLAALYAFTSQAQLPAGIGGGDLKLLAALFAFLMPAQAFTAIAIGCLVWLPLAWKNPKLAVPFGVPVIIGWLLVLQAPHLPKWLFSTI
jgi:prepilin signal peptidase PulO-like enzyme (type II secretory pathway)